MSQPKRYTPAFVWDNFFQVASTKESKDGEYVLYSDYAALAEENERLKQSEESFSRLLRASRNIDDALDAWLDKKERRDAK